MPLQIGSSPKTNNPVQLKIRGLSYKQDETTLLSSFHKIYALYKTGGEIEQTLGFL